MLGFLTGSANLGVEEYKAEIFTHMTTEYAVAVKRAATVDVIRARMSAMKAFHAEFRPETNETFWDEASRRQTATR